MIIQIICAGKIKEKHYAQACEEYLKRLSRFGKVTLTQVPDESAPDNASARDIERLLQTEGERILKQLQKDDILLALAIEGERFTSESFAELVHTFAQKGRVCFAIGGSYGLSSAVYARAARLISLSDMTLSHQLARVVLTEQLYRAATILAGHKYHK